MWQEKREKKKKMKMRSPVGVAKLHGTSVDHVHDAHDGELDPMEMTRRSSTRGEQELSGGDGCALVDRADRCGLAGCGHVEHIRLGARPRRTEGERVRAIGTCAERPTIGINCSSAP